MCALLAPKGVQQQQQQQPQQWRGENISMIMGSLPSLS